MDQGICFFRNQATVHKIYESLTHSDLPHKFDLSLANDALFWLQTASCPHCTLAVIGMIN